MPHSGAALGSNEKGVLRGPHIVMRIRAQKYVYESHFTYPAPDPGAKRKNCGAAPEPQRPFQLWYRSKCQRPLYLQNFSQIRIMCRIRSCSAIFHTHMYRHKNSLFLLQQIWAVLPIFKNRSAQ
jgi:hypothetical protein